MKKVLDFILKHTSVIFFLLGGIIVGLVVSQCAMGETASVTWTNPTQYTNGAALPASDLKQTEIRCLSFTPNGGAKGSCPLGQSVLVIPAPATSATYNLGTVPPSGGVYELDARTIVQSGAQSEWSPPGSKTFAAIPPKPPILTVQAGAVAYELQMLGNGQVKLGRNVGTVTMDGVCGSEFVTGYYAVAGDAVDYYRTPKSSIVVASCT